ncbi:hypothetical protein DEU56DRAFT_761551 [Suillus clintonianus]|uniref:uncharacterized protein n=1 Tax=Suillus clintonianus TaxID=1904413 RepID=UPI001B886796|nr:uncharacterized protein DEU56DRAFT_761551 [Suillus clintonianus]KAG2116277.1 hypothetical protein DEU56DRAFT_761551 [Suillus clintonianus]
MERLVRAIRRSGSDDKLTTLRGRSDDSAIFHPYTCTSPHETRHALLELLASERAYAGDLALLRDVYMRLASAPSRSRSRPSRKFVFLSHQLSARMSKSSTELPKNQQNLQGLVLCMCQEHPFHSLYQVFCLRPEQPQGARRTSSRFEPASSQTDHGGAASAIFNRLLSDPIHTARVRSIEQNPIKDRTMKKTDDALQIPDALLIWKLRDVQVPVMTCHTGVDPTLKYNDCIWISHYDAAFITVGGVNVPKISVCYGSNEEKFMQLEKMFEGFREAASSLRGKRKQSMDAPVDAVIKTKATRLRAERRHGLIGFGHASGTDNGRVQILKIFALSVEDMVDVLTLQDNAEGVENYATALHLLAHGEDTPNTRQQSSFRRVWCRIYNHDEVLASWDSIRETANITDAQLTSRFRATALYTTFNIILPSPQLSQLTGIDLDPNECLSVTLMPEIKSHFPGIQEDVVGNLARDHRAESSGVEGLRLGDMYHRVRELVMLDLGLSAFYGKARGGLAPDRGTKFSDEPRTRGINASWCGTFASKLLSTSTRSAIILYLPEASSVIKVSWFSSS